jgi:cell wall-associated NlpC family hydrolase
MYQKILVCALVIGCHVLPASAGNNSRLTPQDLHTIVSEAHNWQGTRYRYGGKDKQGIDCSHFVYSIYSQVLQGYDYRTADDYLAPGQAFVRTSNPQPGDVIVFPSVNGLSGHVGILTSVEKTTFIGSQTSTGVKEASFAPGTYWGKRPYAIVSLLNH